MKHFLLRSQLVLALVVFAATACSKKEIKVSDSHGTLDPAASALKVNVTTIAGKIGDHGNAEDGNGADARFWNPTKMVFDNRNNTLYVADGTTIRSIDQQNNVKSYMPLGTISSFNEILDIDVAPGPSGGSLYFTSKENDLWKIEPNGPTITATKIIDRVYGGNATGSLNSVDHFDGANGLACGESGQIYFFNSYWNVLHRIDFTSVSPFVGTVSGFAGKALSTRSGNAWPFQDGLGEMASFAGAVPDICSDRNGNVYVADFYNDLVRIVTPEGKVNSLFQYKNGLGIDQDGTVSIAQANRPMQVTCSRDGSLVYFSTYHLGGNHLPALRLVRPGKEVTTLIGDSNIYGDGDGKTAGFSTIGGLAASADGKTIFVSEPGKKVIRKVVVQ